MRRMTILSMMWTPLLALPAAGWTAETAATWRFAAGDAGTCPKTVTTPAGKIVVDLSALPKAATVFRAVLGMSRDRAPGRGRESDQAVVVPAGQPDKPLPLLGPRYRSFDATAAVAAAVKAGAGKVAFQVKALGGWKRQTTFLDVSAAAAGAKAKLPKVSALSARHRNGQTLLTWTQPATAVDKDKVTFGEFKTLRKAAAGKGGRISYRIYRSAKPITAATIARAELVDRVGDLTCWNTDYYGVYPNAKHVVPRYVAADGQAPVAPGTGIYAHNPAKASKAYYAVTCVVAGAEDLSAFDAGNALAKPLDEKPGPGEPICQRIEKPKKFFYTENITLHYYVRWEAPPRCNVPSRPYDYVVIVPAKVLKPAPLNLILHCWGSNFLGKGGAYSWHGWQDKTRGIGVASNQIPYDWWTCYHENAGTWKAWTDGVVRDFTPARLLAFVDWVSGKWAVDPARVCVSGESMGGSGSTFMPIRYPDRFAYAYSAVGIHNPASIKGSGFHESYAGNVGWMKARLKHASGQGVWDYLNDPMQVRKRPAANLPFIGFGNGKNDGGIGWPHAVDLAKAFQEARQPHAVVWRLRGHGSGTFYPNIDFRADQSLPAFTACSLDDDIGTATRIKEPKKVKMPWGQIMTDIYDGDPEGGINVHLRWKTDDVVDAADRWEMTVMLTSKAPKDACIVNITPRRCRKFKPKPDQTFTWTSTGQSRLAGAVAANKSVQSGQATADKFGLVTLEKVAVTQAGNRIVLAPAK